MNFFAGGFACVFAAAAPAQHGPSGQHDPSGQQSLSAQVVFFALSLQQHDAFFGTVLQQQAFAAGFLTENAQHSPSGQQSPSGQHDALAVVLLAVVRSQHGPGQHGPSGQHDPSGQADFTGELSLG
jgi:hypothetical protein